MLCVMVWGRPRPCSDFSNLWRCWSAACENLQSIKDRREGRNIFLYRRTQHIFIYGYMALDIGKGPFK